MINLNGNVQSADAVHFPALARPVQYADALFDTAKYSHGKLQFWEDHYFRLMASMRILRMDIPLSWSPEYLENQIVETLRAAHLENGAARVRLTVFRDGSGKYAPKNPEIGFMIHVEAVPEMDFRLNSEGLNVDLFRDYEKAKGLLSSIKSVQCQIQTLAGIFVKENELNDCLLINTDKHVVDSVAANVFMVRGDELITAPKNSGALNGIMRKVILRHARQWGLKATEEPFSPFDLQRADEVWLTNSLRGIQWVGRYRKKTYGSEKAEMAIEKLNELTLN